MIIPKGIVNIFVLELSIKSINNVIMFQNTNSPCLETHEIRHAYASIHANQFR